MGLATVNLTGNAPGLPVVNLTPEKELGRVEKIVFVKPHEDGFCFVSTFENGGKIYIEHAEITVDSVEGAYSVTDWCRQNKIEHVRYDCSLFVQEGKAIREALPDTEVFLYKPKKNLADRIISQSGFIKSNFVFKKTMTEAYQGFVSIREQFNSVLTYEHRNEARLPKEAYNIAMDMLSDIAKYYRREIL
jgi:hypothetical protein